MVNINSNEWNLFDLYDHYLLARDEKIEDLMDQYLRIIPYIVEEDHKKLDQYKKLSNKINTDLIDEIVNKSGKELVEKIDELKYEEIAKMMVTMINKEIK